MSDYPFSVGDIVISKYKHIDYVGEITQINARLDFVMHKRLKDGFEINNTIVGMVKQYRLHPDNDRLKKLKVFM